MNSKSHTKDLTISRKLTRQAKRQHVSPTVECNSYIKKASKSGHSHKGIRI